MEEDSNGAIQQKYIQTWRRALGEPITLEQFLSSTDYIPAEVLRVELGLSPVKFTDFLREHRSDLPFEYPKGENESYDYREWFYACKRENAATMLLDIFIHKLDYEAYKQVVAEKYAEDKETMDGDLSESKIALAKAQEQIEELQRANGKLSQQNQQLHDELAAVREALADSTCICKGLPSVVCKLRREGKSDEEIAACLYDGGTWCTQAQIGALLHADDSRVASESMQQRARRLLGKA